MSFTRNLKKWLDAEHYLADQTETQAPRSYELRHSKRAKRLQIRILPTGRVEVVIPRGCSEKRAHAFARERADWIERALKKIAARQPEKIDRAFPESMRFPAIGEHWNIRREPDNHPDQVSLRVDGDTLVLTGATRDDEPCISLLKRWLKRKGEDVLIPWLQQVSHETGLPFNKASIRGQKTRWGSCSSHKNISLNYKLLFVDPEQVRYLFIHELAHTRHMNHSRAFWAQVARHEPDYKRLDKALSRATRERVPGWLHG